jgi:plasmid stabilization system protein ParE
VAHRLIFDPAVAEDLSQAVRHYEAITIELANRFRKNVDVRLDDIASRPESFSIDVEPIRFAKVERFPYLIFFVIKSKFVSILAIVHGASDPSKWRQRN